MSGDFFSKVVGNISINVFRLLFHDRPEVYSFRVVKGQSDIPQITTRFGEIVPPSHRQRNCIPSAAIRWPDFGNRPALGRPFGHFPCHPDKLSCRFLLAVDFLRLSQLWPSKSVSTMSLIGYNLPSEPPPRHVCNGPRFGHSGRDVRFRTDFFRFPPRCGHS